MLVRIFGGKGSFKQQAYNYLLSFPVLVLVSTALNLIPWVGNWLAIPMPFMQLGFAISSLRVVYKLSEKRASQAVWISFGVVVSLIIIGGMIPLFFQ